MLKRIFPIILFSSIIFTLFAGQWKTYDHRYAIVVMGGNVTGQMYRWYWNDTSGKAWALMSWGFAPEDIIYLSYGDSATAHPELVDGVSTKANVKAAFDSIAAKATYNDLVHVWWVDHGNTSGFEVHNGFVYFTELKDWIDSIKCRTYIGAYNPCYSGAIMPHMQGLCNQNRRVITATSVNAGQPNSYGWAGKWRHAMRGGRPDTDVPWYADKNMDGYIALDEAYEWETPHSNNAGEYPLLDDNGDGVGGDLTNPATYDSSGQDSTKDGFYSQFYSLMGWYDRGSLRYEPDQIITERKAPSSSNRWFDPTEQTIDIEWSTGAPLPTLVCHGASGIIGDKIYLFGGHPTGAVVNYVYDITNNNWSTVAPMPIHGSLTRGVVHNAKLYVFGSYTLGSDTMRRYDPVANSWELLTAPYTGWRECCKYGASPIGDTIYYYYVEERYSYYPWQNFWMYDIPGDTWYEKTAQPAPKRMYLTSASDGSYSYALGGLNHEDLNPIRDAIRYNPSTGNWEDIDSLPEPIAFADGDFIKGYLFIAGGGAGYGPWPASDKVYAWKQNQGWLSATSLPAAVGAPHVEVATIDTADYIFVFGGYNNGYLNTLYIGKIKGLGVEEFHEEKLTSHFSITPNLIRNKMVVNFAICRKSMVTLKLYDVTGRMLRQFARDDFPAGSHRLSFSTGDLPAGTYFLEMETQQDRKRVKTIKIR